MTAFLGPPLASFVSAKERQPQAEENLAARIVHSGQLGGEPPWLPELVKLKVYDGVSQYEGFRLLVEENSLPENSSGNGGLINFGAPLLRRFDADVSIETHIDAARMGTLACARRGPGNRQLRIDRLTRATGLHPFLGRPAGKLSGGMKQKLGLCCALIHDPDLLILDEPTTGIDPLSRRQFWQLIGAIRAERPRMSVIVSTAYMEEAEQFDWLIAMTAGRILATGSPPELKRRTGTDNFETAFVPLLPGGKHRSKGELTIPPLEEPKGKPAIVARGLTRRFGDFTAVDHVSFDIEEGEIPLGLRQRLSLAVAIVHEPEMLILDEPTSGVGPVARDEFWELLIELSREDKVTVFISTHFMNEAMRCDRISLMHAGKVLVDDAPQRIIASKNAQTLDQAFIAYIEDAIGEPAQAASSTSLAAVDTAPAEIRDKRNAKETRWGFSPARMFAYSYREATSTENRGLW